MAATRGVRQLNPIPNMSLQTSVEANRQQVFRVRGLTKVYGSGTAAVHALAGVDLDLYSGELIVLLGPSGSGKTTLLNNLGGLDLPTAGELKYRDVDLTHADESQLTRYRRESVGFVFQFYNLIPSLTARENVELLMTLSGQGARARRQWSDELLAAVDMSASASQKPCAP